MHEAIRVWHAVTCTIIFIWFYDQDGQGGVFKVMKSNHFLVFLAVWVIWPTFFGHVREWLMLELREILRMLHGFACLMDLNLLCD